MLGKSIHKVCLIAAVAAAFGKLQPAATGLESTDRIGIPEGDPASE
jgi:hypothetical protein